MRKLVTPITDLLNLLYKPQDLGPGKEILLEMVLPAMYHL